MTGDVTVLQLIVKKKAKKAIILDNSCNSLRAWGKSFERGVTFKIMNRVFHFYYLINGI